MENYNSNSEFQLNPLQRPAFMPQLVPVQRQEDRLVGYLNRLQSFAESQEAGFREFIFELIDEVYDLGEEDQAVASL